MSILRVITRNLLRGPATVRFPDRAPVAAGYRGPVTFEPARCLACGLCAYVCVSEAITGTQGATAYGWGYEPARCTFCARCVDHCPGRALSMAAEPAPAYRRLGALAVHDEVPFPPCEECGRPRRPATEELIRLAFDHPAEETRALVRLCERCRRRRLQRGMAALAGAPLEEKTR